jgi:uncharacterized protein (TIGR03437 family)
VVVKDSAGVERAAPLFFAAPGQLNFQLPPGTTTGAALMTVTSGDGSISLGTTEVAQVAPGLFAANTNGQGWLCVCAATVRRVSSRWHASIQRVLSAIVR